MSVCLTSFHFIFMSERAKQEPFVRIVNINVLDNPSTMVNPFQFEIVFESKCDLNEGIPSSSYKWYRFGVEIDLCG